MKHYIDSYRIQVIEASIKDCTTNLFFFVFFLFWTYCDWKSSLECTVLERPLYIYLFIIIAAKI